MRLARTVGVPVLVIAAMLAIPMFAITLPQAEAGPSISTRTAALVASLKSQRLGKVTFKDAELKTVIKWLRIATGKNIVIKYAALAKADIDLDAIRYSISLTKVKVTTLLSILLKPHDMTAVVKGNVLYITSKADSYGKLFTRMYAISHITYTKTDFIAPTINLKPSNFVGEEYEPEVVVEDDPLRDGDAVAELVKTLVNPKGWEDNATWTISATRRHLVVRAPASVHKQMGRAVAMISSMK